MKTVCVITGVAGFLVSLGALTGIVGVSQPIVAVVLLLTSVLLLVDKLP